MKKVNNEEINISINLSLTSLIKIKNILVVEIGKLTGNIKEESFENYADLEALTEANTKIKNILVTDFKYYAEEYAQQMIKKEENYKKISNERI
jgi:hypothetical protein